MDWKLVEYLPMLQSLTHEKECSGMNGDRGSIGQKGDLLK